jgi:uncharacterized membrane protein YbhN (UPF0104 family)
MMTRTAARRWPALIRILVSLGLLGLLLWQIDPRKLPELWSRISWSFLLAALALQLGGVLLSAAKWWLLLRSQGQRLPYIWTVRAYLIGQFFNNFLPTMIGGDAIRAFQLRQRIGQTTLAVASILVERLTGFLALTIIAWIALGASYRTLLAAPSLLWSAASCLALASGGLVIAGAAPRLLQLTRLIPAGNLFNWRGKLRGLATTIGQFATSPASLLGAIALSFVYQLSWIATNSAAAYALRLDAPFGLVALAVPLSDIIGLIPIFFNNLGAREGTYVLLLGTAGTPPASALALAFLIFLVRLLVSALGGVLYLLGGLQRPADDQRSTTNDQRKHI